MQSKNDKILIENSTKDKHWGAKKMLKEFPAKRCLSVDGLKYPIRRIERER